MKTIFTLILIISLYSCGQPCKITYTEWTLQVKYLDKSIDTITVDSQRDPYLWIREGVQVIETRYGKYEAMGVKSFKILSKIEKQL